MRTSSSPSESLGWTRHVCSSSPRAAASSTAPTCRACGWPAANSDFASFSTGGKPSTTKLTSFRRRSCPSWASPQASAALGLDGGEPVASVDLHVCGSGVVLGFHEEHIAAPWHPLGRSSEVARVGISGLRSSGPQRCSEGVPVGAQQVEHALHPAFGSDNAACRTAGASDRRVPAGFSAPVRLRLRLPASGLLPASRSTAAWPPGCPPAGGPAACHQGGAP